MQNVNRGRDRRETQRTKRSGPAEESQTDIFGTSAAEVQTLDLNHATAPQLEAIEDLSAELARAIVEYRVHHGHFTSWDEVAQVSGMTDEQLIAIQRAARIGGHADSVGHLPPH